MRESAIRVCEFLLTPILERNPLRTHGAKYVLSAGNIALLWSTYVATERIATAPVLGHPDAFVFALPLVALIFKRKLDLATPTQAVEVLKALIEKQGQGAVAMPTVIGGAVQTKVELPFWKDDERGES